MNIWIRCSCTFHNSVWLPISMPTTYNQRPPCSYRFFQNIMWTSIHPHQFCDPNFVRLDTFGSIRSFLSLQFISARKKNLFSSGLTCASSWTWHPNCCMWAPKPTNSMTFPQSGIYATHQVEERNLVCDALYSLPSRIGSNLMIIGPLFHFMYTAIVLGTVLLETSNKIVIL